MSEIDKDINVPNKNDSISRQAALDAMDTWDKFGCNPDGKLVRYDDDNHYVPYVRYDDMVHAIKHLPPTEAENIEEFKKNLSRVINVGIVATNTKDDVYSCGMRNGMRWCRSLLEDEPPKFEDASVYVQPTVDTIPVVRCTDCIWMQCNTKPDGTLPKGVDEYECRHWCGACDPTDFCSRGERKDSERHDD